VFPLPSYTPRAADAAQDAYLYYFLLRYPGRTLVFLAAIDGIRRLLPLLELLGIPAFPLHSQLEQRQRLKNLDRCVPRPPTRPCACSGSPRHRFKATPHGVLLATDIAARGLDVPAVDHVVHYQLPRTADAYVHRNGRTARASRDGFSLLMCAPAERRVLRALLGSLGRGASYACEMQMRALTCYAADEAEIPELAVDLGMLDKLKTRAALARRIDAASHKTRKAAHEQKWLRDAADVLGVELEEDDECAAFRRRPGRMLTAVRAAGARCRPRHSARGRTRGRLRCARS
jgi:ATP-dependent RNA helicase DDX24/MAK5